MDNIQDIIDSIPIRHNIVSYIMFLGICQGILLSIVITTRTKKENIALRVFSVFLLAISIITLDNYLCYTGLMKYTLHFNDATEPLVLLLAPLLYLFTYGILERKPITIKKHGVHILPAILYGISQIQYYLNPISVKLNAYTDAYFDKIPHAKVPDFVAYNYHWIKDEFRWLFLSSLLVYMILSIKIIYVKVYKQKPQILKNKPSNKYTFSKNMFVIFLVLSFIVFLVYFNFDDDKGDHYITVFVSSVMILISYIMLSESRFFQNSWIADKYETSGRTNSSVSIDTIIAYVEKEQFYLSPFASLKSLAQALNSSSNYISQTINANMGLNFNDFINQYRIEASKKRLLDQSYKHLTIEAIGNSVGFKSKATFYNAFKKHVALSPSAFIKLHQ
ncbi:helix-turn-helix domain-containing protein [Aquimarina pacifica]|uniref:helix-turn-helix domain-containing protein n=1 Tax=Aquimarina pacifica TaxID=1296415 RepID=UPI00046E7B33|nr:helix-turn-helix domain-containing protein [Aquimarina pacifica]